MVVSPYQLVSRISSINSIITPCVFFSESTYHHPGVFHINTQIQVGPQDLAKGTCRAVRRLDGVKKEIFWKIGKLELLGDFSESYTRTQPLYNGEPLYIDFLGLYIYLVGKVEFEPFFLMVLKLSKFTLMKFKIYSPLKSYHPKRKGSSSKHPFSGAILNLASKRGRKGWDRSWWDWFFCEDIGNSLWRFISFWCDIDDQFYLSSFIIFAYLRLMKENSAAVNLVKYLYISSGTGSINDFPSFGFSSHHCHLLVARISSNLKLLQQWQQSWRRSNKICWRRCNFGKWFQTPWQKRKSLSWLGQKTAPKLANHIFGSSMSLDISYILRFRVQTRSQEVLSFNKRILRGGWR